jgi:uncharacterized protein (DUF433 family)
MSTLTPDKALGQVINMKSQLPTTAARAIPESAANGLTAQAHGRSLRIVAWKHLVFKEKSWRKQAYLKAKNMTVGQLVSTMKSDSLTVDQASRDFDLPREAIKEALAYYGANCSLIQQEASQERKWLEARGCVLEPPTLP